MFVLTEVGIETEPSFQATPDLVRGSATRNPGILDAGFHRHDTKNLSRKIKVKATTVAAG